MMQHKMLPKHQKFSQRLKWLRQREGLSLQEFGERIGFDRSYLSRLENSKAANPSEDFVSKVCAMFRVSFDWLSTGAGNVDDPIGLGLPAAYTPWGKQLEEDTQMTIAIDLFCQEMSSDQLLACTNRVLQHAAMPEKAKLFWIKTLGVWAIAKRKVETERQDSPG